MLHCFCHFGSFDCLYLLCPNFTVQCTSRVSKCNEEKNHASKIYTNFGLFITKLKIWLRGLSFPYQPFWETKIHVIIHFIEPCFYNFLPKFSK